MRRGMKGWCAFMGLWLLAGCGWGRHEAGVPPILPVRPWRGTVLPIPLTVPATYSKDPEPYDSFAFTTVNGFAALFTRDPWQILLFPQLGRNVNSITDPYDYVLLFDDGKNILLYDVSTEETVHLVDGRMVGGFAFKGTFDGEDNLYFLATSDPVLADQRLGFAYALFAAPSPMPSPSPSATPSPSASPSASPSGTPEATPSADAGDSKESKGKPESRDFYHLRPFQGGPVGLQKLNAFAAQHGALQTIRVNSPGDLYLFTTGDGLLGIYEVPTNQIRLLLPNSAFFKGFEGAIDARFQPIFARYILFLDRRRQGLFLLDRWNGTIEPVVFAESLGKQVLLSKGKFLDAFRIVFIATFPGDPPLERLVTYDIVRRTFEAVVFLNLGHEAL